LNGTPGVVGLFFVVVDDGPISDDEKSEAIGITPSCEFVTPVVIITFAGVCVAVVTETVGSNKRLDRFV
jgi:hypothetical protein